MKPLEMISEWRKGCSCGSVDHPEECRECTRALVDAIEAELKRQQFLKSHARISDIPNAERKVIDITTLDSR